MADETRSAGWYPDPDSAAGERWWNGAGWSDSRRGGAGAAASTPYGPAATPVVPVPPAAGITNAAPVIYSAENPAPQRPDPYAQSYQGTPVPAASTINVSVNRNAMVGFVTGIIALFGISILGPVSLVFSALGFVKARQLAAQGTKANLMVFSVIGLVLGGIATIIGAISIIAAVAAAFNVNISN
jgi:hypothetical protein